MKSFILSLLLVGLPGASCFETHGVSELEGNSVTLHTDVKTSQRDRIRWYFNDTRIAQISGDLRKICTDVQCNEGNERFRDRLKLDHQTGSLTITHTRTTDSGLYHQETITSGKISEKIFNVTITGRPGSEAAQMKRRMEGASDTLDNAIEPPTLDQASVDRTRVIICAVLLSLILPSVAACVGYGLCRRFQQNKLNSKNKGATRETYDDEKIASSEMMEIVDYQSSKVEKHNSRDAVSLNVITV
ncbi:uncharacterized protein LOC131530332 isoform X2 [Onychostoma macrolepis]|uniref:uncharacterized protein LOC131530332 isoform X2 n=1 Tax=Onychostoma macrolepis TaxID=369639 RepID=UPI002729DA99|nr:uncharacterized protein LOC131530332 isoform X2 [Onychostoma macrolepis]XP_058616512.1 uncharacterized protein LOC131530332 isoform X2 [Onychostoma macrolepis]